MPPLRASLPASRPWLALPVFKLAARSRRALSSRSGSQDLTRFSYFGASRDNIDRPRLFKSLNETGPRPNPLAHDAALVLATPAWARQFEDADFGAALATLLSGTARLSHFHILCAVVDHIPPPSGLFGPLEALSIVRGHLDKLLPHLWEPASPTVRPDADCVSALLFELDSSRITLPLAQTTFLNHRKSTLLAYRFDMTQTTPRLTQCIAKDAQRIVLSSIDGAKAKCDLRLWAPLLPITHPRRVTESFGNIVRAVQVGQKTIPASAELEGAVESLVERTPKILQESPGPIGVWALVDGSQAPTSSGHKLCSDPTSIWEGDDVTRKLVETTAHRLARLFADGGSFYKILSGGGGWGPKMGLLSLDPQRRQFPLSEEEELRNFMQSTTGGGSFAPPGSWIQFFSPPTQAAPNIVASPASSTIFGVPGTTERGRESELAEEGVVIENHFGALSSHGIFLSGPGRSESEVGDETKVSIPDSRLYVDSHK